MVTREAIEAQLESLKAEQDTAAAQYNAILGAIELCRFLLSQIDAEEGLDTEALSASDKEGEE